MKILIIIPAYNEDQNIVNLIKIIQKNYLNYDILIIDDSSNSLTKEIIEKNKFKNLEYIKRNIKMGRGNAVDSYVIPEISLDYFDWKYFHPEQTLYGILLKKVCREKVNN